MIFDPVFLLIRTSNDFNFFELALYDMIVCTVFNASYAEWLPLSQIAIRMFKATSIREFRAVLSARAITSRELREEGS